MTTTHGSPEYLHRQMIVAELTMDEANSQSVTAKNKAKSMLDVDLAASLTADRRYMRACRDHYEANSKYREALREESNQ